MTPDLAFNTAVSFLTNTNWQSYSPDTTMSYLTQMAALAVQNFVSAAVGIAVAVAMIRGFARHTAKTIGNFWVDVTRCTVYLLHSRFAFWPRCSSSGKDPFRTSRALSTATTLEGATQVIEQGPLASQEAIKMLGTNGGGYLQRELRASLRKSHAAGESAPDAAASFAGRGTDLHVRQDGEGYAAGLGALRRHVRDVLLRAFSSATGRSRRGNPMLSKHGHRACLHRDASRAATWRAKKSALASRNHALFATVTTDASCGAVNGMHDSFTPLGGLVPLFNIQTDEVIFGGVGAGLYSMLIYAIVAVFIGGLMVGRTPEYVGKKIEQKEVKMAIIAVLATSLVHPRLHGAQFRQRHLPRAATGMRPDRPRPIRTITPRTVSRRSCTPIRAAPATTAAPSPESTPIHPGTT